MNTLRRLAGLAIIALAMFVCCDSRADARVPAHLQAQLVARLGTFDRNFKPRAGGVAHVLVVHRAGNAESSFEAASLAKALGDIRDIGGLPPKVEEIEFDSGPALAARCRARQIAMVYFSVGLESEMPRVASALAGVDVLTVGTSARHAEAGAVVGFGLEEARPKIVLNLRQAKAQNVNFKAELLKLARIVD
jgi:hypothetical protein